MKNNGIGFMKAKELVDLGLTSTNQLKYKKFYDKLSLEAQYYITYKPITKIPYNMIKMIEQQMHDNLKNVFFEIAGSYRRKCKYSSDIDFIIKEDPAKFIKRFNLNSMSLKNASNLLNIEPLKPYNIGPDRMSTLFKVSKLSDDKAKPFYVKVDIYRTTDDEYPFMLLYLTGPKEFNIVTRIKAKNKSLLLNHKGIFKVNEGKKTKIRKKLKTEKEILEYIGHKYVKPEKRLIKKRAKQDLKNPNIQ